ncbi:thioredoxin family protein [Mangrovicella endophytica]|uniref:thioredoxin family protein n=1 Tax=Mangrovicella endophytica TaxID=2066697 RepID=UPI001FE1B56D|nr:thioredoxin family protein [Mangrovicella endophytica]
MAETLFRWCRYALLPLVLIGGASGAASSATAAELLMFEQRGCPFCEAFDREIAPDYPASHAGKLAPLRRIDIHQDRRGGIADLDPAVFTPTFVLVDQGREIGRLTGYPGRRWFYPEIDALIDRLTSGGPVSSAGTGGRSPVH